ncbi:MAG: discoidin domain-containing protein [Verrucomicrobia bacterium]|nr:discoidin domain-containing protein [Verrucomicrobiota bacterium]
MKFPPRARLGLRCLLLGVGGTLGAPALADSGLLGWVSPELRRTERQLAESRTALLQLGESTIGNTVPQLGFQHQQVPTPPPQSPWLQIDLGSVQPIDQIALIPTLTDFQAAGQGSYGFPVRFRLDVSDEPNFSRFTRVRDETERDFPTPGVAPVLTHTKGVSARYIRLTVTRLHEANGTYFYSLAEIMVLRGNRNVALRRPVRATDAAVIANRWASSYVTDGRTPLGPPIRRTRLPSHDAYFAEAAPNTPAAWVAVDLGRERKIEEIRLHPLHSWQGADVPGFSFPLQFQLEAGNREDFADARVIWSTGSEDFPNPGNNPVTIVADGDTGRFVRLVATKFSIRSPRFAISELEVYVDGSSVSRGCRALSSGHPALAAPRPIALLTDGLASLGEIIELPVWLEQATERARLQRKVSDLEREFGRARLAAETRIAWLAGGLVVALVIGSVAFVVTSHRARRRERDAFRSRLARDLHDEIGSNLAGIAVTAEAASLQSSAQAGELGTIAQAARDSAEAMREVLWLVGAREQANIDLLAHLKLVAARLLPGKEVVWLMFPDSVPPALPSEARRELFLFFKEALANVARHADAPRVEIALQFEPYLELSIHDHGRGFSPASQETGIGLSSLKARAELLDATLMVRSEPGGGTLLTLRARAARD